MYFSNKYGRKILPTYKTKKKNWYMEQVWDNGILVQI